MTFLQQLGNIGENIVDSVGSIFDAAGTNIEASADANALRVEAAKTGLEIARAKAAAEIREREQRNKILLYAVVAIAILVAIRPVTKYIVPILGKD